MEAPIRSASASSQLTAILKKNGRLKRRGWCTTCCEIVSPALFCCILLLGYSLSEVFLIEAGLYASLQFDVAPLLEIAFESADGLVDGGGGKESSYDPSSLVFDVRGIIEPILKGPLPTLPLDVYVAVGELARDAIGDEAFDKLVEVDRYTQRFGNILTKGTLHLSPQSAQVVAFLRHLCKKWPAYFGACEAGAPYFGTGSGGSIPVRVHEDEPAALRYIQKTQASGSERTWALVSFASLTPLDLNYTIRMNYTTLPSTNWVVRFVSLGLDQKYQRYHLSGFLTLQSVIDEYAFALEGGGKGGDALGRPVRAPATYVVGTPMPTPPYSQNIFYTAVGFLLGLVMTMCQLYPVSQLGKAVVEEKEGRLRQTMRIMGLRPSVFVASWYVTAVLQFLLDALICSLVVKAFCVHTPLWLLFSFIGIFCMGCISFALCCSVFFSNAKLAAVVLPIVFFASVLPKYIFFGTDRFEKTTEKLATSLLLPSAFAFGADILADYEYAQIGVTAANLNEGEYSFGACIGMMLFDSVLYFLLFLYLDRTLPSKYGARAHPLFCLRPSYWRGGDAAHALLRARAPDGDAFEAAPPEVAARASVEVVGLTKVYGSGRMRKVAVDELHLSMYSGQITCLLGHNGAGKTSTIAVLTGLYPPSAGDCVVLGHSITRSAARVYQLMGVCPQHDVLWPRLTVTEHLELYATLKGVPPPEVGSHVQASLIDIGLADKEHARARALSGGMKRKLCVGCALIGGSRVALLDEPSSGMDPKSRRSLWALLQRTKQGRVLVLTTHYMDEADLLADRIAVMSAGKLSCLGSSLFLKARFGLGYTLTVVQADGADGGAKQAVSQLVSRHVASAQLLSEAGGELSYRLPFDAVASFGGLLRELDARGADLKLGGYGMSMTSMEEVFLRLAQVAARDANDAPGTPGRISRQLLEGGGELPAMPATPAAAPAAAPRPAGGRAGAVLLVPALPALVRPMAQQVEMVEIGPPAISDGGEIGAPVRLPLPSAAAAASAANRPTSPSEITPHVPLRTLAPGSSTRQAAESPRFSQIVPSPGAAAEGAYAIHAEDLGGLPRGAPSFCKQMGVLLRKRFTCARRDKKALLSQQLLPVLLVGLVMLILTIKYRRAGPPLRLHAAVFGERTQLVHNAEADSALLSTLDSAALKEMQLDPFHVGLADSQQVSEYLLESYNDHSRAPRFGAFVLNDTLHVRLLADWTASRISAAEGGRLLAPLREVAAGALLGCGSGLLETNQESLLRLNLSLGDLSSGLLNRSRISEALRGANVTALLLQAETALVSLGPRESGSGTDGAAAAQASSTPPSPPSPPLDTSDLLGLLDGALNLGGAGTTLSGAVLRTALADALGDQLDNLVNAIEALPETLSVDSIVAGLAPDQLGDALLLRTESLLLADVCAAAPPLRLDDSTDLGDLGDQLLGGITDRNQQDAVAPLGLGSALLGMTIDDTPLGLAAAGLLFETAAAQVAGAIARTLVQPSSVVLVQP